MLTRVRQLVREREARVQLQPVEHPGPRARMAWPSVTRPHPIEAEAWSNRVEPGARRRTTHAARAPTADDEPRAVAEEVRKERPERAHQAGDDGTGLRGRGELVSTGPPPGKHNANRGVLQLAGPALTRRPASLIWIPMHRGRTERDSFAVVDALRRLVRELRESARLAQGRAQITGAQLYVLRVLVAEPGLSINELAARTMTHQSSVSVVVSRLVARGLATRVQAAADRRRMVVTPTARGRAVHKRAPAVVQESLVAAVREMAPGERRALAGLRALVASLGPSRGKTSMFFEEESETGDLADDDVAAPDKSDKRERTHRPHV